jgi:hypothetical protein
LSAIPLRAMYRSYSAGLALALLLVCLVTSNARSFDVARGSIKEIRKDASQKSSQDYAIQVSLNITGVLKPAYKTTSRMLLGECH